MYINNLFMAISPDIHCDTILDGIFPKMLQFGRHRFILPCFVS